MDRRTLNKGLNTLSRLDPDLKKALAIHGKPDPRNRPQGFETFLSTIISQQISTSAATAIMTRVRGLMPECSAASLEKVSNSDLRQAGLSFRKIEYARGLAEAILAGRFNPESLSTVDDEEAISQITSLRGFGQWSAEIYLMFSLGRTDIFPADDLALQVALGRLKGLKERPTASLARQLVSHWSPWRSAGAVFLWHYYKETPG